METETIETERLAEYCRKVILEWDNPREGLESLETRLLYAENEEEAFLDWFGIDVEWTTTMFPLDIDLFIEDMETEIERMDREAFEEYQDKQRDYREMVGA